jgi:hypothetical protein
MLCVEDILRIFDDRLPIVIYTGYSLLSAAKFERCVPLDMKIKGTSVSPTLSIVETSSSRLLSSRISPSLCLPPQVRSVHFSTEAFRWHIAVKATLRGVNEMLRKGWLPHQPPHTIDDVSTPVFDRALVIVIPCHILESVLFPLTESLIICHGSQQLLDAIPVFEAWETQSCVFFLQHVVRVHLHALLLDPILDIYVLFTSRKWVVGILLKVRLKGIVSVPSP